MPIAHAAANAGWLPRHQTAARSAPTGLASLHTLVRLGVFIGVATSGVVFSEPAPVDLVMMALIVVLPIAGLQTYTGGMTLQMLLWLGCGAGALLASGMSLEGGDSAKHTLISFYLYGLFLVLAAFVANRPDRHTRLILNAWVLGALIAAAAGLIGYFRLLPGAFELFTKFGRAAGTFKDPNVLGPFLVPAVLYIAHRVLHHETRWLALDLGGALVLVAAVLLSFSRGAWINLGLALAVYGALTFVTLASAADRARLVLVTLIGLAVAAVALFAVLQIDAVAALLAERSALTHGYDVGPEGRFGGQEKAMALLMANPLGLGAKQFALHYHSEDVHNVYLSMFLNAGWLGGLLYIAALATTLWAGRSHVLKATPTRPLFLIAFAALIGHLVEGMVIDTDHWRHFYLLLALVWGLISASGSSPARGRRI